MLLPANYIDQDIPSRVLLKNALRSEYERGKYVYFVFRTKNSPMYFKRRNYTKIRNIVRK